MTLTPEVKPEALTQEETIASLGKYGYGWSDSDVAGASAQRGLSKEVVENISNLKNEPESMRKLRLKGKGLPAATPGDLYLELEIAVPSAVTDAQKAAWAALRDAYPGFNPRSA